MSPVLPLLLFLAGACAFDPVPGVSGAVRSVGSDTLAGLVASWADGYRVHYPAVIVEVQGAGSASAPPALARATADIGAMSRRLTERELEAIAARRGRAPLELVVAIDAVVIVVHPDNPLGAISIPELDAVYSATGLCGRGRVGRWGELGVSGALAGRAPALFGRNAASGTYGHFRRVALCGGDYRATMEELPGSGAVVAVVARTPAGVGYVGLPYVTPEVRALAVRPAAGRPAVPPSPDTAATGAYPLVRPLYLYLIRGPSGEISPAVREFARFALSPEGRALTGQFGFVPPAPAVLRSQLEALSAAGAAVRAPRTPARSGGPRPR